jgi:carbon-monoxide dehydrogenase small subunit
MTDAEATEDLVPIRLWVNGRPAVGFAPPRRSLVDFLRHDLGFTGSHVGCEHGVCGACSVVVNGAVVRGCLMLAVQADGQSVETIEGATETGRLKRLQEAFFERAALQCGFCTAGMLLTAAELLEHNPQPTREEIRAYLSGNYCRCTGYQAIVDAIEIASQDGGG